jgi:hypothetical protein
MTQNTTPPAVARAKITPNLPLDLREELNSEALLIRDRIGTPSGDYIGVTKDKTFRLPGTDNEAEELRAVIVDWVSFNQFYEGKFDAKNIKPPVCAAIGVLVKDMKPFDTSPKKQFDNCEKCPKNQWPAGGSGSRECKNQRLLALLVPGQPEGGLALLKVSPTGIRYFDKYVNTIANSNATVQHPIGVVTRITFDQNVDYSSLRFALDGVNEDIEAFAARRKEARTRLLTPPEMGGPAKT